MLSLRHSRRDVPPGTALTIPRRLAATSLPIALACLAAGVVAAPPDTVFLVVSQDTWRNALGSAETPRVDAQGVAVVLVEASPVDVAALSRHLHENERRCGGFFSFPTRVEAEAFLAHAPAPQGVPGGYPIDNQATVSPWLGQVSELAIHTSISALEGFHNRFYTSPTGAEAASWILDQWLALAAGRADVHAELFTDCNDCGGQPSVILTIDGATLPDENVVLGAHLDSVNWASGDPATARAPGADDDASGVATLTEILRIAMASGYRPARTVRFMAYAAEEVGLNGSQAIAATYQASGMVVVGVLQLDMTNYHEAGQVDIEIIADHTDAGLNGFVGDLFDAYLAPLGLTRGASDCGYGCSDHASWQASGYPSSFAFEGGGLAHSFGPIHTADDLLANMGDTAQRSIPFAQLGLAFLGELAKGDTGPLDVIYADGFEPVGT
jgi:leucyl aminopeptidase